MTYEEKLQWFKDRIGKTVYRNSNQCDCMVCKDVGAHGVNISDKMHATYLCDMEFCYKSEGINLNYRDQL